MPAHPHRFWLTALVVAWSVDFLFWQKPVGISLVIFVVLALAGVFLLAWSERIRPVWTAAVLAALTLLTVLVTIFRAEPFTRIYNVLLAFSLLLTVVAALRVDRWLQFGWIDVLIAWMEMVADMLIRGTRLRLIPQKDGEAGSNGTWRQWLRRSAPVLRGLLLALPVVAVMAALLSSADPIFADNLTSFFKAFDLGHLPEYILRAIYVLILAYLFVGLYLHALLPKDEVITRPLNKGISPFLGSIEAFVVLGSVNLLFAFFVVIQFRYLFGGQANITAAGYTYAEYARRGFFELVWVAVLSLGLSFVLGAITRRESPRSRQVFGGFSVALLALVWVILVSAYTRLMLYEDAYGFTRLRTYTHIFIPWLGLLLLGTILLQIFRRERYFLAVLLVAIAGFGLTVGAVNVDGFIAHQNINRAIHGQSLDEATLVALSEDSIGEMVQAYQQPATPAKVKQRLGAVLACKAYFLPKENTTAWQSFHPGVALAQQALNTVDLKAYPVKPEHRQLYVDPGNGKLYCVVDRTID